MGTSTAALISVRCAQTSSTVTRLSALPIVHAKPALVEASALKPRCCSAFAVPTSTGFGSTKQPASCSLRKLARLSVVVTGMVSLPLFCRQKIMAKPTLCHHLAQETTLLREDEFVLLGEVEIRHAVRIAAQPRPVGLVGGKALERDQRERDVVGALMRHEI